MFVFSLSFPDSGRLWDDNCGIQIEVHIYISVLVVHADQTVVYVSSFNLSPVLSPIIYNYIIYTVMYIFAQFLSYFKNVFIFFLINWRINVHTLLWFHFVCFCFSYGFEQEFKKVKLKTRNGIYLDLYFIYTKYFNN